MPTDEVSLSGLVAYLVQLAVVAFLVIGVPVLMYRDMRARQRVAWAYVLLYLLVLPVGLLTWYIDRRRFPLPPPVTASSA